MTFCSIWQFHINTFWTARMWPAWSFNSDRTKHTPSDLLSKCGISSTFLQAQAKVSSWAFLEARQIFLETHCRFELNFMTSWDFLGYGQRQSNRCVSWWNSQSFKRFFSICRLLQQKTMITVENDIVAGDVLLWLRETFTIPSDRSAMVAICFGSFFRKARQRTCCHPVRKWNGMRRAL